MWVYAIPAAVLLLAMLIAIVRLFAMHRRATVLVEAPWLAALALAQRRMGFKHGTALLVSEELHSPVSWGMMRPIILLNPAVIPATGEAEAIIAHELAHVARLDWAKLLLARVACAVFWFNPLVWLLARESHQLREEAADDAVLLSDVDGADYASLLVNAARHDNQALLLAAHGVAPGKDSLKRRITRVLDASLARRPANLGWVALCLVAVLGVAGPLAALDPAARAGGARRRRPARALADANASVAEIAARAAERAVPNAVRAALDGKVPPSRARRRGRRGRRRYRRRSPDRDEGRRPVGRLHRGDGSRGLRRLGRRSGRGPRRRRHARIRPRRCAASRPASISTTVVEAYAVGLSAEFIGQMRGLFPSLDLDGATELAALGITPDYVRAMRRLFPGLDRGPGGRAEGRGGDAGLRRADAQGGRVRAHARRSDRRPAVLAQCRDCRWCLGAGDSP